MAGDLQVVAIFSADDTAPVWELVAEWEDVFDIDVSPAVSAEDGLRIRPEVFGRFGSTPRLHHASATARWFGKVSFGPGRAGRPM